MQGIKKKDRNQRIYAFYDSTNKGSRNVKNNLIGHEKSLDDRVIPLVNVAVAYDKNNRVSLWYEEYLESITDVSQFKYMADKVNRHFYKDMCGYSSKDNIRYMEESSHVFIIMVKGQKELVSSPIHEYRNTFETKRDCNMRD